MVEIVYRDFLSGRVKVPLKIVTRDEGGFDVEVVCLSKDIRLIMDDGSKISFDVDTDINKVAETTELANEMLPIKTVDDIKVFDSSETIRTDINSLRGSGFYDGFQEWWFVARVFEGKSMQYLRFSLDVKLEDGEVLSFKAGTRWTACVQALDSYYMKDAPKFQRSDRETVFCTRRCCSPLVPNINPDDLDPDFMKDIGSILSSDE